MLLLLQCKWLYNIIEMFLSDESNIGHFMLESLQIFMESTWRAHLILLWYVKTISFTLSSTWHIFKDSCNYVHCSKHAYTRRTLCLCIRAGSRKFYNFISGWFPNCSQDDIHWNKSHSWTVPCNICYAPQTCLHKEIGSSLCLLSCFGDFKKTILFVKVTVSCITVIYYFQPFSTYFHQEWIKMLPPSYTQK